MKTKLTKWRQNVQNGLKREHFDKINDFLRHMEMLYSWMLAKWKILIHGCWRNENCTWPRFGWNIPLKISKIVHRFCWFSHKIHIRTLSHTRAQQYSTKASRNREFNKSYLLIDVDNNTLWAIVILQIHR